MGTICDDKWDIRDARVVCNMLGFDGALAAPGRATFGAGNGEILLDDVECKGMEDTLAGCFHRGLGVNNCNHDSDAGVVCFTRGNYFNSVKTGASIHFKIVAFVKHKGKLSLSRITCIVFTLGHSSPIHVRLVGGENDAEGTVNVMHNGSWGTVCDFNWDLRDASVVCRMLGFGGALEAPRSARFGQGSGRILLNWVECDGSEDTFADCTHPGIGDYSYCGHNKDAGVVCFLGGMISIIFSIKLKFRLRYIVLNFALVVRLADGASEYEGRVEIFHEGSWGTVCDDMWDLDDATVVCRHLGFVGALAALPQAHFGEGSGDILLDGVQCNGSEANLKDCKHKGIGVHNCAHKEDAGVICTNTGFTTYSDTSNPDEMHSTNTPWLQSSTHIPNETTDPTGTQSLEFSTPHNQLKKRMAARNLDNIYMDFADLSSLNALSTSTPYQDLHAPPRLPDRQKTGVIRHEYESQIIMDLPGNAEDFNRFQYIGKGDIHEYTDMKTIHQTYQRIEDKDMDGYCRPDTEMPSTDEKAIADCGKTEMLNMSDDNVGIEFSPKGKNENMTHDYMDMKTVYQKPKSGEGLDLDGYLLPDATSSPNHGNDFTEGHPNPFQVRLIDGANDAEGRVEVLHDGSWGTICDVWWDLRDAKVVCRMLGYDGAVKAPRTARFGRGSGRILLRNVNCEGTEDNLADCAHPGIGRYTNLCTHSRDAGAVCYSGINPDPLQVRLAGGLNDAEGRVEVLHDGSWGTICDNYWDLRDARVVCRMLGFDGALEAPRSARFGQGSGRSLLNGVGCDGTEDNLADCAHAGFGRYSCSHAGAICYSEGRLVVDFVNDLSL
ncbi:deleted in malignant brain tumors 1 protein-like [Lytechinus variegatus]|uniref:deleted in malignant brain tumors 1 protein-like n=1 Tax=Lytechinus variegatus TaxID=7654 RepID=UPI001BB115ED|nr:deleted in malignant brain tumors 1 protein-like [Lytechinus variegatus]